MRKLFLLIPFLMYGAAYAVSGILNYQGAFVLNKMYHQVPLLHANMMVLPVVTSNTKTCVLIQESLESAGQLPESYVGAWDCTL